MAIMPGAMPCCKKLANASKINNQDFNVDRPIFISRQFGR